MADKRRDTIHISYNDKEYYEPMSELVNEWEKQNKVRSKEVCKYVLAMNDINNSITLNKVLNAYKMIENILSPFFEDKKDPKYKQVTEAMFSEIIKMDGDKFSTFFSNPINKIQELIEKVPPEKIHSLNQEFVSEKEVAITSDTIQKEDINDQNIKNEQITNISSGNINTSNEITNVIEKEVISTPIKKEVVNLRDLPTDFC